MKTEDFAYELPESFIAQVPAEPRDNSRLMVLDRKSESVIHRRFYEIGAFLKPNDLLVVNKTRVIPARLYASKLPGGGKVEILLLKKSSEMVWETLVGGKNLRPGVALLVTGGPRAEVLEDLGGAKRLIAFNEPIETYYASAGHVPLPPYIHGYQGDPERYQTVYNHTPGSAAAPTAGLHFTAGLLEKLKGQGVKMAEVTLHVGLDTFAPVGEDDPATHHIHREWCELDAATAEAINQTRNAGGRVIAVGTTSVRTLETSARQCVGAGISPWQGETDLFILPGYQFKVVDAMITNFHLPKSTLLMLVSAFYGREKILKAYEIAKNEGYRFFSFGDAMFIH